VFGKPTKSSPPYGAGEGESEPRRRFAEEAFRKLMILTRLQLRVDF
jgi:hypothetical protein